MSQYPPTNVEQLISAGVLNADHCLSEADQQQLNALSPAEIAHVISIGEKLDAGFYERNSASFAGSNFI